MSDKIIAFTTAATVMMGTHTFAQDTPPATCTIDEDNVMHVTVNEGDFAGQDIEIPLSKGITEPRIVKIGDEEFALNSVSDPLNALIEESEGYGTVADTVNLSNKGLFLDTPDLFKFTATGWDKFLGIGIEDPDLALSIQFTTTVNGQLENADDYEVILCDGNGEKSLEYNLPIN